MITDISTWTLKPYLPLGSKYEFNWPHLFSSARHVTIGRAMIPVEQIECQGILHFEFVPESGATT